ncbi:MAG: hypothetical protein M1828_007163 [Chrysothrix sp. TS-e1954]|nr:MAG: hypothetical protein M1828_007163 [Chrysothrix sp. TS-e1954]
MYYPSIFPAQRSFFRDPRPPGQQHYQETPQQSPHPGQQGYLPTLQPRPSHSSPQQPQGQFQYAQANPRYGPPQPYPAPQLPGYDAVARGVPTRHEGERIDVEMDYDSPPQPPHQPQLLPTPAYPPGRPIYQQTQWGPGVPQNPGQFHQHALPGMAASPEQYSIGHAPVMHRAESHEVLVGKEGYPGPIETKGLKSRFTAEEDRLLRVLKEWEPKMSWKQIADFFPNRRSGTLQLARVKTAINEDHANTYHRVALKVGEGLTAEAIQKKFEDDQDDEEARRIRQEQAPEDYEEATGDAIEESPYQSRRGWG